MTCMFLANYFFTAIRPYSKIDGLFWSRTHLIQASSIDVVERLKEITLQDYSETLGDKDNDNPPYLHVFGKYINGKEVYIKLKIRDGITKKVLCLSFHYAEYCMNHPYG